MNNKNVFAAILLLSPFSFFTSFAFAAGNGVNPTFTVTATIPYAYQISCSTAGTCTNDTVPFGTLTEADLKAGKSAIAAATVYTNDTGTPGGVTYSVNPPTGESSFALASTTAGVNTTIPYTVTYTDCTGTESADLDPGAVKYLPPSASAIVPVNGGAAPCSNYESVTNPTTPELGRGDFTFKTIPIPSNFPEAGTYTQDITINVCADQAASC